MPFSLFEDLKRPGFHSSIMTTFSVDPAFYDANIQFRLRAFGCQNNLLLADATMLNQSLEQMPDAFVHAGRKYLIVPVSGRGCFHPKITLRYGQSKCRLLIGSGNATSAGWGSNRELISAIEWAHVGDTPDQSVHLGLIAKVHDWLIAQLPKPIDADLAYKLRLLESQCPWLSDAQRSDGVETLDDGTQIGVFLSDPGRRVGLADDFLNLINEPIERLVVISPYWDSNLRALRRLSEGLGKPNIHVFIEVTDEADARQSEFPVDALDRDLELLFHPLRRSDRHRFLHAKLIMAQTSGEDIVLYGSSNCTTAALGQTNSSGSNWEAAVFRRLPRGTVDRILGLDYSETIKANVIKAPEAFDATLRPLPFDPGSIERRGERLLWTCPAEVDHDGAVFLSQGRVLPLQFQFGTRPWARIEEGFSDSTIIVRVRLRDGRESRPVIVTDPDMLMVSAPGPLTNSLKRRLDAVLNGDSDLIDLARDVHLIFADRNETVRSAELRSRSHRPSKTSTIAGEDYDSPEDFRKALALKADLFANSIPHADNPALQAILQIVLRGIIELPDSRSIDEQSGAESDALAAGEDQDDVGDEVVPAPASETVSNRVQHTEVDAKTLERNRASLARAIQRFDAHVAALCKTEGPLQLDFVTRCVFMVYLMFYGCSKRYKLPNGSTSVLLPFSGIGTYQQDGSFLLTAARLMNQIWGTKFQKGLMARVAVDREHGTVPTPIVTFVILSRWILAAILTDARAAKGAKSLRQVLENQIPRLYRNTEAFGQIDPAQLNAAIDQMARHLEMDDQRLAMIRRTIDELCPPTESARAA